MRLIDTGSFLNRLVDNIIDLQELRFSGRIEFIAHNSWFLRSRRSRVEILCQSYCAVCKIYHFPGYPAVLGQTGRKS
jgi:hypothetical protein